MQTTLPIIHFHCIGCPAAPCHTLSSSCHGHTFILHFCYSSFFFFCDLCSVVQPLAPSFFFPQFVLPSSNQRSFSFWESFNLLQHQISYQYSHLTVLSTFNLFALKVSFKKKLCFENYSLLNIAFSTHFIFYFFFYFVFIHFLLSFFIISSL